LRLDFDSRFPDLHVTEKRSAQTAALSQIDKTVKAEQHLRRQKSAHDALSGARQSCRKSWFAHK
jgi:hypothetical protein